MISFLFFRDEDLFDQEIKIPQVNSDSLISIEMIKKAVDLLAESTSFLSDFEVLNEQIPVVQTTINGLIAGPDRSLADLFNLTDWASTLTESKPLKPPTAPPSRSPSTSPSLSPSKSPSALPSMSPSTSPTISPTRMPTTSPSKSPTIQTISAQFVKISLSGSSKTINILEVQVFDDENTNVAAASGTNEAVATQSSTFINDVDASCPASYANDGNTGTIDDPSVCQYIAHTQTNSEDPWWMVNMNALMQIKRVVVWNRSDCCTDRLTNATVSLLDENSNVVAEVASIGDTTNILSIELGADDFIMLFTRAPTTSPSLSPSASPSRSPSTSPSSSPSKSPSTSPSRSPSTSPSLSPSKSPSLSPSVNIGPMIKLSDLLSKMRRALSSTMKPDLSTGELPPVPDLNIFQFTAGTNCANNNKAVSIDIIDIASGGLEITICTFIDYELEGQLSADGLLEELEESISLDLDAGYVLKGAFSAGIKITVTSLTESPSIELDPIITQLEMQSSLSGMASLGLITATVSGNAAMQGNFSLAYCPDCSGTYSPDDNYERAGGNSSFYFSRLIGYNLDGALELSVGISGVEVGVGVGISIEDDDVFDDDPPAIQLPDAQSLIDSMKFSPQTAVNMLQLVDAMLAQASGNKAFDAQIPLLDTSVKSIINIGTVFTSALFEIFVQVQPFEDRASKSLTIKGCV